MQTTSHGSHYKYGVVGKSSMASIWRQINSFCQRSTSHL